MIGSILHSRMRMLYKPHAQCRIIKSSGGKMTMQAAIIDKRSLILSGDITVTKSEIF